MDYRYGSSGGKPDEDEETERGHKQSRQIKIAKNEQPFGYIRGCALKRERFGRARSTKSRNAYAIVAGLASFRSIIMLETFSDSAPKVTPPTQRDSRGNAARWRGSVSRD